MVVMDKNNRFAYIDPQHNYVHIQMVGQILFPTLEQKSFVGCFFCNTTKTTRIGNIVGQNKKTT